LIENGADLKITNQTGEMPRDVAKRFSQLAAIKLLQSEIGESDDEDANEYYRKETTTNSEAKDPILLSGQQKKEAKSRAKKRLEEIEKQINIARSNYIQLGGKLDEAFSNEFKSEQNTIK
jgi:ankyrin repeat domain-containing protein 42